jgi:aminomethyltransferase
MPVEYPGFTPQRQGPVAGSPGPGGGLIAEHLAVRTGVGLFDVSHMGEIRFLGSGALEAIQRITMNDARHLRDGQAQYSALLTPEGSFVDDILVHRLSGNEYLLVVNASNKDKDFSWIQAHAASLPGVRISDESSRYSQLALQGPRALETLQKLTKTELAPIRNYWFTWGEVAGVPDVLIARTGYSGEDGFELYLPAEGPATVQVWSALLAAGAEFAIRPCGLGARNTLRLEAGMTLYGHEISASINVFEAGLEHWLKLDKNDFIGREALLAIQAAGGPQRKIIALEMVERGIARDGYPVLDLDGHQIGAVTSGSFAPFLKTSIALALVPALVAAAGQAALDQAAAGQELLVQIRANRVRARQVPFPFYKRAKK